MREQNPDRQTDRQTDRDTYRQTDRQTELKYYIDSRKTYSAGENNPINSVKSCML